VRIYVEESLGIKVERTRTVIKVVSICGSALICFEKEFLRREKSVNSWV